MQMLAQSLAERCADDWSVRLGLAQCRELHSVVRTAFIDTSACLLAGRAEPVSALALRWARTASSEGGPCTVLFGNERLDASGAALVNGVTAHALDFDDVALAGHPSVALVPVLLAEHERSGVRGFDLVQAYAKGFALWADLQARLRVSLHARGWHPTAVFGVLAATAAVASSRRLSAAATAHALGIAASQAAGVVANFGSMTKPLHVGQAAQRALMAVDLAQLGFDASLDALDGPAGLLCALVGRDHVDLTGSLATDFESTLLRLRPGIKKYPVCYAAHRVVDGVLGLVLAHDLEPVHVARVDATISRTAAGVLRQHEPRSVAEARFSLEFVVAAALARRSLGINDVCAATLSDPAVGNLMLRVHTHVVDTSCPLEPSFALTDEVKLTLHDGRVLQSGPIRFARGHAECPLQESELHAKLFACVGGQELGLAEQTLHRIDEALQDG